MDIIDWKIIRLPGICPLFLTLNMTREKPLTFMLNHVPSKCVQSLFQRDLQSFVNIQV
jgi:hypothetical protein